MANIGFIGTGTMCGAVAQVVANNSEDCKLFFANRSLGKAEALAQTLGGAVSDNETIARTCELIFLGVKPQMLATVFAEISSPLCGRLGKVTLISMAAGVSTARIREMAGGEFEVIRMMPNTPLMVGSGVVQYCGTVPDSPRLEQFGRWMAQAGVADLVPESLMDAASAVSGCGPAFCAMFIEALADGGVRCGLSRKQALDYAVQTMIGTGEMIQQAELHPALVKDRVCSPGGSTIAGVAALEENKFRSGVIQAVEAAFHRSEELGKA